MAYLSEIRDALLALRSGERRFDDVVREADGLLRRRAAMYTRRWRSSQDLHDDEDILQVMRLALWRAVETWDSARGVCIAVYADIQIQHAAREALRKAAGYPDPRRAPPIKRVHVEDVEALGSSSLGEQEAANVVSTLLRRLPRVGVHGIVVSVAEGMLLGYTTAEVARQIYADPGLRLRYRLDSEAHAQTAVKRAALFIRQETAALMS